MPSSATALRAATVTPEARALADAASMSRRARRLYVSTRPTVDDRATFADHCPDLEAPDTYLLGCYRSARGRIHLLRIDRPELTSGMTVTAAHEMLHAVYASLGHEERQRVDGLTKKAFAKLDDPRLHAVIATYPAREVASELHSRLGTEVAGLPPALERYYATYFRDRSVVVAASSAYRHVFDDLETQIADVENQIEPTLLQLKDLQPQLDAARAEADRLGAEIDRLRSQGQVAESNALVDTQNTAVDQANVLVDEYNALVTRHNELVASYNALLLTNQQLVESLKPVAHSK